MRAPADVLIVDSAILIAAVRGRSAPVLAAVAQARRLVINSRIATEVRRRVETGMARPDLAPIATALIESLETIDDPQFALLLPAAARALREAVPSANGSERDAHILALAWALDGEVWSTDRDFAGAGVASWSTPNLMRALG